jgi:pyrimidine precursor biosynthesis enzyme
MSTEKITFLTNWSVAFFALDHCGNVAAILTDHYRHATPYHAPVYLAQAKGYFADEGLKVALLEPNDPSVCVLPHPCNLTNAEAL